MMQRLTSTVYPILFGLAFLLLGLAILERLIRFLGAATFRVLYDPGRLAEFSAMVLLFVIALQLREIKILLRGKGSD
jgi:hypothetical protein